MTAIWAAPHTKVPKDTKDPKGKGPHTHTKDTPPKDPKDKDLKDTPKDTKDPKVGARRTCTHFGQSTECNESAARSATVKKHICY